MMEVHPTLMALGGEAFRFLFLWIYAGEGEGMTLAGLGSLVRRSPYHVKNALRALHAEGLACNKGLAYQSGLQLSPFAVFQLTPHAFNLFPLPGFERSVVPGSLPSQVLAEAGDDLQDFANRQDLLQKKFFSDDESLRVVVVNTDLDQEDPQQRLGAAEKIFSDGQVDGGWPVREILEMVGIERRRHPGPAMQQRFVAWLVYGYQFKKSAPNGQGIVSPALFALTRIGLQPGQNYLDIAAAGPVEVLAEMEPYRYPRRWYDILEPARKNGLYELLECFFVASDEDAKE